MNNVELLNLVRDKKVAIVGPAPHLTGKKIGNLIDSYDVVVRVNYFQTPKETKKDYGSRTDIMFHNFGTPWLPALKELIYQYPEDFDNIKVLGCPVIKSEHSEINFLSWPDDYVSNVVRNCEEINKNKVPFYWIGVPKYKQFYREIGCEPYSGTLVISILLSLTIKELFITGFTFYKNAKTPEELYFDGYKTKNHKNKMPGHSEDSSEKSFNYFIKTYKENMDVISVDDVLDKIIKDSV
jgi:hypothetical protein